MCCSSWFGVKVPHGGSEVTNVEVTERKFNCARRIEHFGSNASYCKSRNFILEFMCRYIFVKSEGRLSWKMEIAVEAQYLCSLECFLPKIVRE